MRDAGKSRNKALQQNSGELRKAIEEAQRQQGSASSNPGAKVLELAAAREAACSVSCRRAIAGARDGAREQRGDIKTTVLVNFTTRSVAGSGDNRFTMLVQPADKAHLLRQSKPPAAYCVNGTS